MEDLKTIKFRRKKLNLTQMQFAKLAGVSQSLIAKIEAGLIDPSYSNAQKIFDQLNRLEEENDLIAEQIMHRRIISLQPNADLKEAIMKMKRYEISQLPIFIKKKVMGFVSESSILEAMMRGKRDNIKIRDIMEDLPPIVPFDTSKRVVINLLKHFPLVLVSKKGKIRGIITRADLLKSIYE